MALQGGAGDVPNPAQLQIFSDIRLVFQVNMEKFYGLALASFLGQRKILEISIYAWKQILEI